MQTFAQQVIGPFDYRDFDLPDMGVSNPHGIAYAPDADVFFVLQVGESGSWQIVTVTPYGEQVRTFEIDSALSAPVHMAYDGGAGQLLLYDAGAQELIALEADDDGLLTGTVSRQDASGYGLSLARGMALDGASQRLYLLDATSRELVVVRADSSGSYAASDNSRVSRQALAVPAGALLRGMAYHASSGHFFTLDAQAQALYELDAAGQVVARYAVDELALQQVQGLVVAPTADGSDDPALLDLYLVDSQLAAQAPVDTLANKTFLPLLRGGDAARASRAAGGNGRLLELYLTRLGQDEVSVAAETAVARLVRTTDTSADFNPPSTDSSGLAYVPSRNRLLMSDSEINEIGDLYEGVNVWEITLDAVIQRTYTTDPGVSDEPTGLAYAESRGPSGNPHLFVSDDTGARAIYVVDLGPDGEFRTGDDVVTSIDFGDLNLSWTADPEGVAYDSWNDQVVVIDGINQEVYVIHPGADNLFGTADDTMVNFDVGSAPLSLTDPEGVEFDPDNGHLYILGRNKIAETLLDGTLVRFIDIKAIPSGNIAGIAKAPPSTFDATHPNDIYLYISDRGVDEGFDGRLYEIGVAPLASDQDAPVVNAGPDQNLSSTLTATLSGTVSDDGLPNPPGQVTTQWLMQSGPGTVSFSNVNALDTTATFSTPGVYVLRLLASDGELTGSDDVTILVDVTHTPPTVEAGPNKTVAINAAAQLNGTATDDGLPNPPGQLATTWSVQTGPGTVTFGDANALSTTANFSEVGSYLLRLTANDGQLSASDDMTVTVTLPPGYQSIERQINANSDDAEERGGSQPGMTVTFGDLEMVFDNDGDQTVGLRFNNITIPKGMTIARAYIQFSLDEAESVETHLIIQGQKSSNAPTFSSSGNPNFNITSRPRTTAAVAWNPPPWAGPVGTANGAQRTPDLTPVVQEIINQSGWASGNSLVFIISGTGERVAVGHDDNPAQAAKLYIEFNPTLPGNQEPVVDAGVAQTVTLPAGVTLNGIVTDDGLPNPPGVLTTTWQMESGPGTVTFGNVNALNTTASFTMQGSYVLRLTAEDGQLAASDVVTITVHPENQAPLVDAGTAQTVTLPASATLTATVTDDGWPQPPGVVTTTWQMASGPAAVTFGNANALSTTVTFSSAGIYVLRLTANDGALTAFDDVTVTVNPTTPDNQAPVVDAGADQTIILPANVSLTGTVSDDGLPNPPGVVTATWQMESGPGTVTFGNANAVDTTASFSAAGVYVLRLTAEDSEFIISDVVTITVHPQNQAPVVDAGVAQTVTLPASATLQGTVTDDGWPKPPGKFETLWTVVSGPDTVTFSQANALETTVSFPTDGIYILRLAAHDGEAVAFDLVTITVHPVNQAPTVDAGADQTIVLPAQAHLNATVTDDGWPQPPGEITASWSVVSGPGNVTFTAADAVDTSASFSVEGTYVLRLTVTDGEFTRSDDVTITVQPTGEEPVVDAGPDQTIMLPNTATLQGTVTDDGWPQPPGEVTISWHKQSGPGDVTFDKADAAQTTASFSVPGTYVLRLEAFDGEFTSSDLVTVVVHPENTAPTADAGGNLTLVVTDTAVLQAVVGDDGLPDSTLTVTWSVVSGPGTVTFGDPNAATTTVSFSESGAYVLRLTVSDGDQETHDEITVTVLEPAEPPPTPKQRLFLPGLFNPSTSR